MERPNESLTAMLRQTTRLQDHLHGLGYGAFEDTRGGSWIRWTLREVEIVPAAQSLPDSATDISAPLAIPPGFSFWTLERLTARSSGSAPVIKALSDVWGRVHWREKDNTLTPRDKLTIPRGDHWALDDQIVNVWWLSPTEFMSPFCLHFQAKFGLEFSFDKSCTLASKKSSFKIYVYHIDSMMRKGDSFPETSVSFLKHLAAPELDKIGRVDIHLQHKLPASKISSVLSFIPTNSPGENTSLDRKRDILRVNFGPYELWSQQHVEAVLPYPFHRKVRLEFAMYNVSFAQYRRFLVRFEHLRHVVLPSFLSIADGKALKTSNSVLESLTVHASQNQVAIKVIEGNKNIKHLCCASLIVQNEDLNLILDLLRKTCVKERSSISGFTLELDVRWNDAGGSPAAQAQGWFAKWCTILNLSCDKELVRSLAISCFWFAFWNGRQDNVIKSNETWDCIVVPALTVNWYRQSWRQPPSTSAGSVIAEFKILEMAIRAVNQGNVYCKSTNVIPFDHSVSGGSVIFGMLKRNVYPILKGQRQGKRLYSAS
jgi:hypothetical protein